MEPLKLVMYPNPILTKVCEPFDFEAPQIDLAWLVSEMKRIMREENGIGLAAPQVGTPLRIFMIDGDTADNVVNGRFEPMVFINPVITVKGEEREPLPEGCLSFPISTPTVIERPLWVSVRAFDVEGNPFEFDANLLLGRVLQHENDHLDGKTLFNYTHGLSRQVMMKRIQKARKNR